MKYLNLRTNIALGLICTFLLNSLGPIPVAQADDFVLPKPGEMVALSPEFNPPILKGIKVHPDNPFRFDFILDKGDSNVGNGLKPFPTDLKNESSKLIKYFLASLTVPEKDLWVNLSPYEKDRIVPNSFGMTEMGRDLLAEDYMLKQITASLIYPEGETGKKFWAHIYAEAAKKYGTTNIPVNTFNKVWIVPEKAVVYENAKAGTAYVVEAKLKVMLEQDYLSLEKHSVILSKAKDLKTSYDSSPPQADQNDTSALGSQIIREIVIPELTREVNEGKNFSQLRQVYNSLILATWYKKKIKDSILEQVYADRNKINGVQYDHSVIARSEATKQSLSNDDVELIYQRYLQAFKKGVYNYIKEDVDPVTQQTVPRKYFSGGVNFFGNLAMITTSESTVLPQTISSGVLIETNIRPERAPQTPKGKFVTRREEELRILDNFGKRAPQSDLARKTMLNWAMKAPKKNPEKILSPGEKALNEFYRLRNQPQGGPFSQDQFIKLSDKIVELRRRFYPFVLEKLDELEKQKRPLRVKVFFNFQGGGGQFGKLALLLKGLSAMHKNIEFKVEMYWDLDYRYDFKDLRKLPNVQFIRSRSFESYPADVEVAINKYWIGQSNRFVIGVLASRHGKSTPSEIFDENDLNAPLGSVLLDPTLKAMREKVDRNDQPQTRIEGRQKWLKKYMTSAEIKYLLSASDGIWTFAHSKSLNQELLRLIDLFSKRKSNPLISYLNKRQKIIIFTPFGHMDEDLTGFRYRGISFVRHGKFYPPLGNRKRVPIIVVIEDLPNKAVRELVGMHVGTLKRSKDHKRWVDFPLFVTGNASWMETISAGILWRHDNNDGNAEKFKDIKALIVRKLLDDAKNTGPVNSFAINEKAFNIANRFISGSPDDFYDDLDDWTLWAHEFSDQMYGGYNRLVDILGVGVYNAIRSVEGKKLHAQSVQAQKTAPDHGMMAKTQQEREEKVNQPQLTEMGIYESSAGVYFLPRVLVDAEDLIDAKMEEGLSLQQIKRAIISGNNLWGPVSFQDIEGRLHLTRMNQREAFEYANVVCDLACVLLETEPNYYEHSSNRKFVQSLLSNKADQVKHFLASLYVKDHIGLTILDTKYPEDELKKRYAYALAHEKMHTVVVRIHPKFRRALSNLVMGYLKQHKFFEPFWKDLEPYNSDKYSSEILVQLYFPGGATTFDDQHLISIQHLMENKLGEATFKNLDKIAKMIKAQAKIQTDQIFNDSVARALLLDYEIRTSQAMTVNYVPFFPSFLTYSQYKRLDGIGSFYNSNENIRFIYKQAAQGLKEIGVFKPEISEFQGINFLLAPGSFKSDNKAIQMAFLAATFFTYNVALYAYFKQDAQAQHKFFNPVAYSGKSLGILTAAAASGAIDIKDGVKLAYFIVAKISEGSEALNKKYYVVHMHGHDLTKIEDDLKKQKFSNDVELLEEYTPIQSNFFVEKDAWSKFSDYMQKSHKEIAFNRYNLTQFLAHISSLENKRHEVEDFIDEQNIVFNIPEGVRIISNSKRAITNAADLKQAILDCINEPMYSVTMVNDVKALVPAVVIEFGLGGEGSALFHGRLKAAAFTNIHDIQKGIANMAMTSEKLLPTIHLTNINKITMSFQDAREISKDAMIDLLKYYTFGLIDNNISIIDPTKKMRFSSLMEANNYLKINPDVIISFNFTLPGSLSMGQESIKEIFFSQVKGIKNIYIEHVNPQNWAREENGPTRYVMEKMKALSAATYVFETIAVKERTSLRELVNQAIEEEKARQVTLGNDFGDYVEGLHHLTFQLQALRFSVENGLAPKEIHQLQEIRTGLVNLIKQWESNYSRIINKMTQESEEIGMENEEFARLMREQMVGTEIRFEKSNPLQEMQYFDGEMRTYLAGVENYLTKEPGHVLKSFMDAIPKRALSASERRIVETFIHNFNARGVLLNERFGEMHFTAGPHKRTVQIFARMMVSDEFPWEFYLNLNTGTVQDGLQQNYLLYRANLVLVNIEDPSIRIHPVYSWFDYHENVEFPIKKSGKYRLEMDKAMNGQQPLEQQDVDKMGFSKILKAAKKTNNREDLISLLARVDQRVAELKQEIHQYQRYAEYITVYRDGVDSAENKISKAPGIKEFIQKKLASLPDNAMMNEEREGLNDEGLLPEQRVQELAEKFGGHAVKEGIKLKWMAAAFSRFPASIKTPYSIFLERFDPQGEAAYQVFQIIGEKFELLDKSVSPDELPDFRLDGFNPQAELIYKLFQPMKEELKIIDEQFWTPEQIYNFRQVFGKTIVYMEKDIIATSIYTQLVHSDIPDKPKAFSKFMASWRKKNKDDESRLILTFLDQATKEYREESGEPTFSLTQRGNKIRWDVFNMVVAMLEKNNAMKAEEENPLLKYRMEINAVLADSIKLKFGDNEVTILAAKSRSDKPKIVIPADMEQSFPTAVKKAALLERVLGLLELRRDNPRVDGFMNRVDGAMRVQKGGIDFTAAKTPLEIRNAGEGIKFHLDPAQLQELQNAPGFVPIIINIQPLRDIRKFLGIPDNLPSTAA